MSRVKRTFPELPGWVFDVDEISAGVYRARAVDEAGRSVEASGTDPNAVVEECRKSAVQIQHAVPRLK